MIETQIVKSQAEVAAFFGVSPDTAKQWKRRGMPGGKGRYPLREIARWLRESGPWKPHARPTVDADPMLAGPESPALERYREARAKLAELDLAERTKTLVDMAEMHEWLSDLARHLRRAGERIDRLCGPEPKRILDEALDLKQA